MKKNRYYFDMDGTLFEWKNVKYFEMLYEKGYYLNLKPNMSLVNAVKRLISEGEDVYVLSSYLTDSPYALDEKNQSLDKHLSEIPQNKRIFVHYGDDKSKYIEGGIYKDDYLIDDYTKNLIEWEEAGGEGIKFLNEVNHSKQTWEGKTISLESHHTCAEIKQLSEHEYVKQIPRDLQDDTFNQDLRLYYTTGDFELYKKHLNILKETYDIKILNMYECERDKTLETTIPDRSRLVQYMLNKNSKCTKVGYEIFEMPDRYYNKTEEKIKSEIIELLYGMNISKQSLSTAQADEYARIEHFLMEDKENKSTKVSYSDAMLLSKYDIKNSPHIYQDYKENLRNGSPTVKEFSDTCKENSNEVYNELEEERDIF